MEGYAASHGNAEASKTYPTPCSNLRKGGYVMLKGHPCKIVDLLTSNPGKHGHSKIHLVGLQLFTAKKYEDICPSSHKLHVPHIKRIEYQLLNVESDGYLSLMDEGGCVREDLSLPRGQLGESMTQLFDSGQEVMVTVTQAADLEAITAATVLHSGSHKKRKEIQSV